jgi:hypothetical protein
MEEMMNRTVLILSAVMMVCLLTPVHAGPIELIQGVSGPLLQDYTAPLAPAYGVAMTSGLYHTRTSSSGSTSACGLCMC